MITVEMLLGLVKPHAAPTKIAPSGDARVLERREEILRMLKRNGPQRQISIARHVGINANLLRFDLRRLEQIGMIRRVNVDGHNMWETV